MPHGATELGGRGWRPVAAAQLEARLGRQFLVEIL